jgi:hypothetical protein
MRRHVVSIALVAVCASTAHAKPTKLVVGAGNGTFTLIYEPAKVAEAELRDAVTLAPESNPAGVVTGSLDTCRDVAGKTTGCGTTPNTPARPTFFRDAERTVAENKQIVKGLADRKVPAELQPAKEWLRRQAAIYAGLEERKLAFYRSWKSADLAGAIEGVEHDKHCAAIVAKIGAAPTNEAKAELVKFGWHNCVNDRVHATLGEYAADPWKAYLKARGVTAKHVLDEH